MENKHALLSASGSHRWSLCPGSIKMCEGIENTSSDAAREGTLMHELLTARLQGERIEVSEEREELLAKCEEIVNAMDGIKLHEVRVDFGSVVPGQFGTADLIVFDTFLNHLTVIDYKFGSQIVYAEGNTQLFLYLVGALKYLKDLGFPDPVSYKVMILQPKLNNFDEWDVNENQFNLYSLHLRTKGRQALEVLDDTFTGLVEDYLLAGPEQCEWCPARGFCRPCKTFNLEAVTEGFGGTFELTLPSMNSEEIAIILNRKKSFFSWFDAVEKYAFLSLEAGKNIPGWHIGEGRSNRKWIDEEEAKITLEKEVDYDKLYLSYFISPAQAEELVGKSRISSLIYKPRGALTLKKGNPQNVTDDFEEQ